LRMRGASGEQSEQEKVQGTFHHEARISA
jgi:hypothetical protein